MKPVDEMTLDEVRLEICKMLHYVSDSGAVKLMDQWCGLDAVIPATLDAAAELPEGWMLMLSQDIVRGESEWIASGFSPHAAIQIDGEGPTELLARFRLRLAVLRATKKGASDGLDG